MVAGRAEPGVVSRHQSPALLSHGCERRQIGERAGGQRWSAAASDTGMRAIMAPNQPVTLSITPGTGATGAALTLNAVGSSAGHIRVTAPGAKTRADTVDVSSAEHSANVFARLSDGQVGLTNTSKAPASVTVAIGGWITSPQADGGRLAPAGSDLGVVKTSKAQTLTGPASARAVVLAVTTKGAKKAGGDAAAIKADLDATIKKYGAGL